jgi:nucleoside-diphosphate-sugar epimerase
MSRQLLIFGLGYTGLALACAARDAGIKISVTVRTVPETPLPGINHVLFDEADQAIAGATHIVSTIPPSAAGDPVISRYATEIGQNPKAWLGYYSTTGVYGDRGGAAVEAGDAPKPQTERAQRRLCAEIAWRNLAAGKPLDIFRIAGIYGARRSVFDDLRAGTARRIDKPGHVFGRIHRDDIAGLTLAAMDHPPRGTRILHLTDNEPAEPADVTAYAAKLLNMAPPPLTPYAEAAPKMSDMAKSFWTECRRVSNAQTLKTLNRELLYPTYREGLRAILREEQNIADSRAK